MAIVKIYDTDIVFKGRIDNYESMTILRKYRGTETINMKIASDKQNVDQLQKHRILEVGAFQVFEIEHSEYILTSGISTLSLKGYGFGKTLKKRITKPPAGQAYDRVTASSAETVVKEWIDRAMVNAVDPKRVIPYMSIATDANQGSTVDEQSRNKSLRAEVERVLTPDDLGYRFSKSGSNIEFDVYEGLDRTVGNGVNPPAIFSVKYDNIIDEKYIDSAASNSNQIYVGGQGTGAARTIVEVGTYESFERYEMFVDARDTNDTNELTNRGVAAQVVDTQTVSARIDPNANLDYRVDFDLGDLVTIQIPSFGLQFNQRITEVRETYQAGQPVRIDISFGKKFKEITKSIIDNSNNIKNLEVI